jgi:CheY-like chemotaxis protein
MVIDVEGNCMDPMPLRTHLLRDFGNHLARISIGLSPQTASPSPRRFSQFSPPTLRSMTSSETPRILAVEDNSETQLLLEHLLKGSYETEVVAGVEAALAAVEETPFEVLLLDINLSEDQTGTDLLHLIRERDGMGQVPAIALTAYAMPGDREDFLEKGFDEYVSKPFTRDDLTEAIESTLNPA